jgi:hypothetical protein
MIEFSDKIQTFLKNHFPDIDLENMSVDELEDLKKQVIQKRQEYSLLELAMKTSGNAAYGACASPYFFFFNPSLAGDITGECRELTQTMWRNLNDFFRNKIWERKDLWEKFNFELDESKREFAQNCDWSIYSDTDSCSSDSKIFIKELNKNVTIEDLFKYCYNKNGVSTTDKTGHEIVSSNFSTINYDNNKLKYSPIKRVIRHKVSKSKFKIKTKSGKEIIVTGDHSCIVFRNGEKIVIKAKDINKDTDKILSISHD